MMTLAILILILMTLAICVVVFAGIGGLVTIAAFGDVIVCGLIIGLVIRMIVKNKKKK